MARRTVLGFAHRLLRLPRGVLRRVDVAAKEAGVILAPGARLHPSARVFAGRGPASVRIGMHSQVMGTLETRPPNGQITIGAHTFVSEDTRIWSSHAVLIGDRVMISHGVNIHDTSSHSLSAAERHRDFHASFLGGPPQDSTKVRMAPIVIEDDAWIGFGATVLRGVTVGRGAVVAAGCMVTKDVLAYTVVGGNPMKVIGTSTP